MLERERDECVRREGERGMPRPVYVYAANWFSFKLGN
jgi:hypothetical protein